MPSGLSSLLWFCAVLALIPVSLWLLKRTPMGGGVSGQHMMKSIAALPLSTSQRIVTVEVGSGEERCWLVLGVTASSITTLHTMAPQDMGVPMPGTASPSPGFAQMLTRLRGDKG